MVAALSMDVRERIVARYHQGKETYKELAELFNVGESSVARLLRLEREQGDLRPAPHGGGYPPRITDADLPRLAELVAEKPDRTLAELCAEWVARFGGPISNSSMYRALERAGITRKKRPSERRNKTGRTFRKSGGNSSKNSCR
jgi:transposase